MTELQLISITTFLFTIFILGICIYNIEKTLFKGNEDESTANP